MRLLMMAGHAAGGMSAVIAKTRARLLSVTSGPSVGRGLLLENNDFLVGVVLLRQITHADHQMSRILIFGHMILLGFSQAHLLSHWTVFIFLVLSQQGRENQGVRLAVSCYEVRILVWENMLS